VFSSSHDHTVKRIRLSDGTLEQRLPGYREQVSSVSLSQDASLLAAASGDARHARGLVKAGAQGLSPGAIRLWDARTGRLLRRLGDPAEQFLAAALSPDGRIVAGGGGRSDGSGVVHVWDAASGKLVWSMNDHAAEVLAVAITADGASLASAGADGAVRLRDIRTGAVASTLEGHVGGATSLAFSADGSFLVCGAGNGATHIWETATGRRLRSCQAGGSSAAIAAGDRVFNCIGLSQDGGTLAASRVSVWNMQGEPVKTWDPRTGALLRDFSAEKIQGRPMALSPDGAIVATGGKLINLYDVRTGKRLRELFGHLKRTQSIVFSADGRLLVSGGNYGTINAWEVATGRHLITLFTFTQTHSGPGSDEWLASTPEGYYNGSPGVDRYLSWRVGDELQTPAELGEQLRRPDRVESALKLPFSTAASR
jgi:WD40 repeat protein